MKSIKSISFIVSLCIIVLSVSPVLAKSYAEYLKDHQVSIEVQESGFCKGAPLKDKTNYYCGFYALLDSAFFNYGQVYSQIVKLNNNDKGKEGMIREVDLEITVMVDPSITEKKSSYNIYHNKISVSPQVVNITSGLNLAMRRFYTGTCDTVSVLPSDTKIKPDPAKYNKLCNKVIIPNLTIEWPFQNNLLILINDERFQFPVLSQMYNIEPINVNMVIRDSKIKTVETKLKYTGEIYQNLTWKINPEKYWMINQIFSEQPGASFVESLTAIVNLFFFVVSVLSLLIFMIRKWMGLMFKQIKYSQVVKKFDRISNRYQLECKWTHLELYGPDIVTDDEDEEQESKTGLLAADGNLITENDIEDGKNESLLPNKIDDQESSVSYYTVDNETGEVVRKLVKKSILQIEVNKYDKDSELAQKVDEIEDADKDVEMIEKFDITDTDIQGLQIKEIEGKLVEPIVDEDARSKRTDENKVIDLRIEQPPSEQEQIAMFVETPPEFIDSENQEFTAEMDKMIGKSIDQDDLQNKNCAQSIDVGGIGNEYATRVDNVTSQQLQNKAGIKLDFTRLHDNASVKRNKKGVYSQKGSNKFEQLSEGDKPLTQRGRNGKRNKVIDEKGILKDRKGRYNNQDKYRQVLKIRDHSVGSQRELHPAKGFDFNEDSTFDARNLLDHNNLNGDRKIDRVGKFAINSYLQNKNRRNAKNTKIKRSYSGNLRDVQKIVQVYAIYGNDKLALVNPREKPNILQVRERQKEKRIIQEQINFQQNNAPGSSVIQNGAIQTGIPNRLLNDDSKALSHYQNSNQKSGKINGININKQSSQEYQYRTTNQNSTGHMVHSGAPAFRGFKHVNNSAAQQHFALVEEDSLNQKSGSNINPLNNNSGMK